MSKPIRLLLVDDHSVVRMGLSAVLSLESDLCVVAEAEDGAQAVERFRAERPDVVLMDVRMPGTDGVATLRTILAENPAARVLMLTTSELDHDIHLAMAAGAAGYLPKSVSRRELVHAIRQVHAGAVSMFRLHCRKNWSSSPRGKHCRRASTRSWIACDGA